MVIAFWNFWSQAAYDEQLIFCFWGEMALIKKFVLPGFVLLAFSHAHAENSVLLADAPNGNQWFITMAPEISDAGAHAAHLRVDFAKSRSFLRFHQVKSASLSVRFSCSKETIEIDSINLLGESGHEIAKVAATESSSGAAQHLPPSIVKSAFSHACMKQDAKS